MTARELYYGPVSPFARAVRIVLTEKGLAYDHAGIFPELDVSPTNQVPVLVDDGQVIWDSAVIIEYLMETYPNAPQDGDHMPFADVLVRPERKLQDTLTLAALQTLGTSLANLFQFRREFASYDDQAFLQRCAGRAESIFAWCEDQLIGDEEGFFPGAVSVADVRLATSVAFIDKGYANLDWKSLAGPKIQALVARLENRPSFVEHPVPTHEPDA